MNETTRLQLTATDRVLNEHKSLIFAAHSRMCGSWRNWIRHLSSETCSVLEYSHSGHICCCKETFYLDIYTYVLAPPSGNEASCYPLSTKISKCCAASGAPTFICFASGSLWWEIDHGDFKMITSFSVREYEICSELVRMTKSECHYGG